MRGKLYRDMFIVHRYMCRLLFTMRCRMHQRMYGILRDELREWMRFMRGLRERLYECMQYKLLRRLYNGLPDYMQYGMWIDMLLIMRLVLFDRRMHRSLHRQLYRHMRQCLLWM